MIRKREYLHGCAKRKLLGRYRAPIDRNPIPNEPQEIENLIVVLTRESRGMK